MDITFQALLYHFAKMFAFLQLAAEMVAAYIHPLPQVEAIPPVTLYPRIEMPREATMISMVPASLSNKINCPSLTGDFMKPNLR